MSIRGLYSSVTWLYQWMYVSRAYITTWPRPPPHPTSPIVVSLNLAWPQAKEEDHYPASPNPSRRKKKAGGQCPRKEKNKKNVWIVLDFLGLWFWYCFRLFSDDTSNTARAGGPLSTMANEVGCDPSKSPDRVRVCVSCNRVRNLPYLQDSSPNYKYSTPNSIKCIRISS
jgi:hypothetical protein